MKLVENVPSQETEERRFLHRFLYEQREKPQINPLTYFNLSDLTTFMYLNKTLYSGITSQKAKFVAIFPVFAEDDSSILCPRCCLQYMQWQEKQNIIGDIII